MFQVNDLVMFRKRCQTTSAGMRVEWWMAANLMPFDEWENCNPVGAHEKAMGD